MMEDNCEFIGPIPLIGPILPVKKCGSCEQYKFVNEFHCCKKSSLGRVASCKTCQKEYHRSWFEDLSDRAKRKYRKDSKRAKARNSNELREKDPIKHTLRHIRKSARKRGLDFSLSESDLNIPEVCPILGVKLSKKAAGGRITDPCYPTVDRIDPGIGYVKGNVHIVSYRANTLKNNGTLDEFRKLVKWMEEYEESTVGLKPIAA